jgi:hypothetical protein
MIPLAALYTPSPRIPLFLVMDRGGVYLRPDSPFWMIRFRLKGRLFRESSRAKSKKEALAFLRRRMAEFGLGSGGLGGGIPTLGEAAEALLSHMRAANRSGHAEVRSHLRSIVAHFGTATWLAEISPERMDAFMAARRASGLKDDSVYNEMSTLRRCLRLQWKTESPARAANIPDARQREGPAGLFHRRGS